MTNPLVLKAVEKQVLIAIGQLALAEGATADDNNIIKRTKAELIGIVEGIRNIVHAEENHPMTLGELEQRQFERARNVPSTNNPETV